MTKISVCPISVRQSKNLDYTMCDYENSEITVERVKKILNILNVSHLNSGEIQNICAKLTDLFFYQKTHCQQQMCIDTKFS